MIGGITGFLGVQALESAQRFGLALLAVQGAAYVGIAALSLVGTLLSAGRPGWLSAHRGLQRSLVVAPVLLPIVDLYVLWGAEAGLLGSILVSSVLAAVVALAIASAAWRRPVVFPARAHEP